MALQTIKTWWKLNYGNEMKTDSSLVPKSAKELWNTLDRNMWTNEWSQEQFIPFWNNVLQVLDIIVWSIGALHDSVVPLNPHQEILSWTKKSC